MPAIMFIAPDTVPEYRPPMSMAPAHAGGMAKSLKKPAIPSMIIALVGSPMRVKMSVHAEAARNPVIAMTRRALATLPVVSLSGLTSAAETRHPTPPKNSGSPESSAPCIVPMPRASRR